MGTLKISRVWAYNPFQEHGRDRVQWRFIVELSSTVGAKQVREVHVGGNATPGCSAATLGLSLVHRFHETAPIIRSRWLRVLPLT
jgi:hypothetical protein